MLSVYIIFSILCTYQLFKSTGIPDEPKKVSDEERVNRGEAIHELIFGTPITTANRVYSTKIKFDKAFLNELLSLARTSEYLSKLSIIEGKETGGNIRYEVDGFDNDKLEITITSQSQGYIGVRYAMIDRKYPDNPENNQYSKALENLGFRDGDKGGHWLGVKTIGQYKTKDLTEIIRNIEADIKKIQESILQK